jgi:hypothetical protein
MSREGGTGCPGPCVGDGGPVATPNHATERTWMKRLSVWPARIALTVGLLTAGFGVSAALADPGNGNGPPTTVPGSPGDDCSHGNSNQDCRPDPQPGHGQECDDHGNASGNEDHCDQTATTTTTTTTETTTTTTTSTTPANTNPGSSGTPSTPPTNGPSSPSGGSGPSSTPPPVTKPELQNELANQVKKSRVGGVSHTPARPGELPFTGFPAWALAIIGSLMLATGLGLRRLAS